MTTLLTIPNLTINIGTALTLALAFMQCKPNPETSENEPPVYTIEQFMDTEQIFGGSFSPDQSKILYTSKVSGIFNS